MTYSLWLRQLSVAKDDKHALPKIINVILISLVYGHHKYW